MKKIKVVPYNNSWPKIFAKEAALIQELLANHCLRVHHIGSTSVANLIAKEDIDILCIIDKLENSLVLQEHGFIFKSEINIPLRYFFSKNSEHSKVNLHVVEEGHGFIALNLAFRDYLRENQSAKEEYAALKRALLKKPTSYQKKTNGLTGYNAGKNAFIELRRKTPSFRAGMKGACIFHKVKYILSACCNARLTNLS